MQRLTEVVCLIEDDPSMRGAIRRLVLSVGIPIQSFSSAEEFLNTRLPDVPACVILDVRLPGMSGLGLQTKLAEQGVFLPIIFITGHGDITMSVKAMKAGAVEFLTKPFREQDLLDAIKQAIEADRQARQKRVEKSELKRKYDGLTPREREVMAWVVDGLINKQIADRLGITEKTIKIHRHQVMAKMRADSLAELVRMADRLSETAQVSSAKPVRGVE